MISLLYLFAFPQWLMIWSYMQKVNSDLCLVLCTNTNQSGLNILISDLKPKIRRWNVGRKLYDIETEEILRKKQDWPKKVKNWCHLSILSDQESPGQVFKYFIVTFIIGLYHIMCIVQSSNSLWSTILKEYPFQYFSRYALRLKV